MCNIHYLRKCGFLHCDGEVGHVYGMCVPCETARSRGDGIRCERQLVSTEPAGRQYGWFCYKCLSAFPVPNGKWEEKDLAIIENEKKALTDAIANMNKRVVELPDETNAATQTGKGE